MDPCESVEKNLQVVLMRLRKGPIIDIMPPCNCAEYRLEHFGGHFFHHMPEIMVCARLRSM